MKSPLTFSFVFFFLLIISCKPVKNITVTSVDNTDAAHAGSFIYALPLTVLDVYVVAEEVSIIPGPYEKFAEKYLGIQHVPVKAEKRYHLVGMNIGRHIEADPDLIYTVSGVTNPKKDPGLVNLMEDSLILSAVDFSVDKTYTYLVSPSLHEIPFTDLSIKRNFEAEKDIEISTVLPDTVYPASRNKLKEKTVEQKAEEAANFLIKLKKRRFKLVAGQYESMPEGEAMSSALQELERIEKEYLSLFIGKRIINRISKSYHYVPVEGKTAERAVLFNFSESEGFLKSDETGGIPVMLEIESTNKVKNLTGFRVPLKPAPNTIPYRIADQASVRLLAGEQIWAEAFFPLFQYGVVIANSQIK